MAACRRYELFEARREKKESSSAGGLRCIVGRRKTVYLNTQLCQRVSYKSNGRPSRVRNRDGLASPRQRVSA